MAASASGFRDVGSFEGEQDPQQCRSLGMFEATISPSSDRTRSSIGAAAVQSLQDASQALIEAAGPAKTARLDRK